MQGGAPVCNYCPESKYQGTWRERIREWVRQHPGKSSAEAMKALAGTGGGGSTNRRSVRAREAYALERGEFKRPSLPAEVRQIERKEEKGFQFHAPTRTIRNVPSQRRKPSAEERSSKSATKKRAEAVKRKRESKSIPSEVKRSSLLLPLEEPPTTPVIVIPPSSSSSTAPSAVYTISPEVARQIVSLSTPSIAEESKESKQPLPFEETKRGPSSQPQLKRKPKSEPKKKNIEKKSKFEKKKIKPSQILKRFLQANQ